MFKVVAVTAEFTPGFKFYCFKIDQYLVVQKLLCQSGARAWKSKMCVVELFSTLCRILSIIHSAVFDLYDSARETILWCVDYAGSYSKWIFWWFSRTFEFSLLHFHGFHWWHLEIFSVPTTDFQEEFGETNIYFTCNWVEQVEWGVLIMEWFSKLRGLANVVRMCFCVLWCVCRVCTLPTLATYLEVFTE